MLPVIRVEQLGKCYRLNHARPRGSYGYGSLREDVMKVLRSPLRRFTAGSRSASSEEYWALKDVSI